MASWWEAWLTWLVDPAEGVPGVVLAGLEAVLTEVKVIAVSAFEPGTVDGEHLAAVTPADAATCVQIQRKVLLPCKYSEQSQGATVSADISRPDSRVNARHQLHFRQEAGPVRLLREVHYHVLPIGTES